MTAERPHVIILAPGGRAARPALTQADVRSQLAAQTEAGRTAHFVVYSDGTANGNASARGIVARAEDDYAAVRAWFGGLELPPGQEGNDQTTVRTALPMHVLMDAQAGGAYHFGCAATDLYVEPDPGVADGLMVAELVEVFEAAQARGWDCGLVNGEALSRVLATERQPELGALTQQTGQGWWANGHADYVTSNTADDQNQDANGCGPLFLYYLHSQLGFSWQQITAAAGPTLGACYQTLTGKAPASGFADFVSRLATLEQGGQLALPASGNPFPIAAGASGGSSASGSAAGSAGTGIPGPSQGGRGGMLGIGVGVVVVLVALAILLMSGVIHLG